MDACIWYGCMYVARTTSDASFSLASTSPESTDQRVACRRLASQVLDRTSAGSGGRCPGPRPPSTGGGLLRLPWLVGDNADEVFPDDDFHHAREFCTEASSTDVSVAPNVGRPHNAAVQHSWHANVVRELEPAGDDRGKVEPRTGFPRTVHSLGRLPLRGLVQRDVELLSADQLAVAHALRGVAARPDRSVNRDKAFDGHAQPLGSKLEERFARGGSGEREIA